MKSRSCLLSLILLWAAVGALSQSKPSVSGTVTDAKNSPLEGAQVHLMSSDSDVVVLTDDQGKFTVPNLQPGVYQAHAAKKFYAPSPTQGVSVGASMKEVSFTLAELERPGILQLSTADVRRFLPEGNGEALFYDRCGRCHGASLALSPGPLDREGWDAAFNGVSYVVGFNEVVNDKVRGTILDYLAGNFGPGSTLIGEMGEKAEKAYQQDVPLGHNLMYTVWDLHLRAAEPHTAAPDNEGNVWVTEFGDRPGMVTRVHISTGQLTQYQIKTPGDIRPFSVGITPDGKAWFTAGPELGAIDPKSGTLTEMKIPGDEGKRVNGSHLTISDGKVWFGVSSPGRIVSYDPKDKQFKSYKIEDGAATPDGITKHGDKFWFVLGRATKVGYLEPETGKVQTFPVPTPHINSEHLTVDPQGRVWLAEQDESKLWVLDPSTETFKDYDLPYTCQPYMIGLDVKGKVWANCFMRESLVQVDPDTKKMVEYPQPIGLGGVGRSLLSDSSGNMWFASWYTGKLVRVTELP